MRILRHTRASLAKANSMTIAIWVFVVVEALGIGFALWTR